MPGPLDYLKEVAEDLTSLEVATFTNKANTDITINGEDLTPAQKTTVEQAKQKLTTAQTELLTAYEGGQKDIIKNKKQAVKQAEKNLSGIEDALGIYDPKDIFSRTRATISTDNNSVLVAYSRFEIEGDSLNFISNNERTKDLTTNHKEMVAAAQESRQALFDTVLKLAGR